MGRYKITCGVCNNSYLSDVETELCPHCGMSNYLDSTEMLENSATEEQKDDTVKYIVNICIACAIFVALLTALNIFALILTLTR